LHFSLTADSTFFFAMIARSAAKSKSHSIQLQQLQSTARVRTAALTCFRKRFDRIGLTAPPAVVFSSNPHLFKLVFPAAARLC
jgi:hypothetical protein